MFTEIGRDNDRVYYVNFVICGNDENLLRGAYDVEPWDEEATTAAVGAAGRAILDAGFDYEVSTFFADWNGGKYYRQGDVAMKFECRKLVEDDYGEIVEDDSEWCSRKDVPADLLAKAEAIQEAAATALGNELAAWEARVAKERAEADAEEAIDD